VDGTGVIAGVLQNTRQKERAIYALLTLSFGVASLAAVQFASPADASINVYEARNNESYAMGSILVGSTGRARVSSTFTFVSGFVAFTLTVPTLLLSIGLDTQNPRLRRWAFLATGAAAAVVPMSGSRSAIVVGIAILGLSLWSAGLFFTRVGRRILLGAGVAAVLSVVAFPDAMLGVQSRFANEDETAGRFKDAAAVLPPVALLVFDYPGLGLGTGMQQNARLSFGLTSDWDTEAEVARYLVELGPIGFILFWITKLGLMVALLRAYGILKRAGRRGSAAAALSYAGFTMYGNLTFDHNWQALYFTGCGFILAEVVTALSQSSAAKGSGAGPAPSTAQLHSAAGPA